VLLGWAFAGEAMTLRTMLASAVIVAAVALIIRYGARRAETPARESSLPQPSPAPAPRQATAR